MLPPPFPALPAMRGVRTTSQNVWPSLSVWSDPILQPVGRGFMPAIIINPLRPVLVIIILVSGMVCQACSSSYSAVGRSVCGVDFIRCGARVIRLQIPVSTHAVIPRPTRPPSYVTTKAGRQAAASVQEQTSSNPFIPPDLTSQPHHQAQERPLRRAIRPRPPPYHTGGLLVSQLRGAPRG